MDDQKAALGFIGAGNMAEAIARGILAAGIYAPTEMIAVDPSPVRRDLFTHDLNIPTRLEAATFAGNSQIILLAVKPQKIAEVLAQLQPVIKPETLVISIVAAVSTEFIRSGLLPQSRVIRVMPNTPMLVGAGTSALARGRLASEADMNVAREIFGACGTVLEVPEHLMNAVTCLSGSGPAYVFYLAEALALAGQKLGLAEADARLLARQTIIGAGVLLAKSEDSPTVLRQKVTSPGGFTEAAVKSMESSDFFGLMITALQAAAQRGEALAQ